MPKDKEKQTKSKIGHMIESSKKMQKEAAHKRKKQNDPEKKAAKVEPVAVKVERPPAEDWQEQIMYFWEDF